MNARSPYQVAAALAAAALAWVAVCSWRGLVEEPHRFTSPALLAAVLVAGVGAGARLLRVRWYLVPLAQLLVVTVWLHQRQDADTELGGWLPTPDGIAVLARQVRDGAEAINTYAAPVSTDHANAPLYLLVAAIGVIVLVDLIACGLRHPAWAGLPVLVALTVPISVLDGGLPLPVYLGAALLYALLLAVIEADRALLWGHDTGSSRSVHLDDPLLSVGVMSAPALGIGAVATVGALVLSLGVPLGDGIFASDGDGGNGDGDGGSTVSLVNPLVNMQRELRSNDHTPLLRAITDADDPSYLRLTVLDVFSSGEWRPSTRSLNAENVADGRLPGEVGVPFNLPGRETRWQLATTEEFRTGWLPTPVPVRSITISRGDWRYDPAFLDIASVQKNPPRGVAYDLTAFEASYTAADLDDTAPPPVSITRDGTKLPTLPGIVQDLAEQVTAGGATTYQRARLLQDWFRRDGGFEYDLQAAGSAKGIDALESFLTVDKVGYCEQFAAAMAVMARSIGIPARVAVGFLAPQKLPGGRLLYTSDDLHAWPEIYFRGYGWVRFEPTPSSRTGTAPSWTRGSLDRPETPTQAPTASAAPSQAVTAGPQQEPEDAARASDDAETFPSRLVAVIALALVVVLVLVLPALARGRRRARRLAGSGDPGRDVEQLWQELRDTATDHGIGWPSGRSPRMVADEVATRVLRTSSPGAGGADRDALEHLVRLVERARYSGAFTLDADDRVRAVATVERWSALMSTAVSARAARRARFLPRSVLSRGRPSSERDAARDELTEVG